MTVSVPTHPKTIKGRRYRVVIEGRCDYQLGSDVISIGNIEINADDPQVVSVEVLPDPLKVGDELTGASLEPPEGTVVIDHDSVVWQRFSKDWRCPQGGYLTWPGLVNSQIRIPLTVLYVPEESR